MATAWSSPATERWPAPSPRSCAARRRAMRDDPAPTPSTTPTQGRPMKATWNGVTIAESDDTVVVEGNHYFPEASLKREYTSFSNHRSSCVWKGQAHYYSLMVDGNLNENAVWYYPEPSDAAKEIKGRVAFWKGVKVSA